MSHSSNKKVSLVRPKNKIIKHHEPRHVASSHSPSMRSQKRWNLVCTACYYASTVIGLAVLCAAVCAVIIDANDVNDISAKFNAS
jgi:hypothetical protein